MMTFLNGKSRPVRGVVVDAAAKGLQPPAGSRRLACPICSPNPCPENEIQPGHCPVISLLYPNYRSSMEVRNVGSPGRDYEREAGIVSLNGPRGMVRALTARNRTRRSD